MRGWVDLYTDVDDVIGMFGEEIVMAMEIGSLRS